MWLKPKMLKCLILRIILIDHFTLYKGMYTDKIHKYTLVGPKFLLL